MDAIQKTLIKAGRKDLAGVYYKRIIGAKKVKGSDIKEMISKGLKKIPDQAFANVLRNLIFTQARINWESTLPVIHKHMPETRNINRKG